jgi:hypothetical protein
MAWQTEEWIAERNRVTEKALLGMPGRAFVL